MRRNRPARRRLLFRKRTAVGIAAFALAGCGTTTRRVTVGARTPPVCLTLAADARQLAEAVLAATERMGEFQPLITRAAEAGANGDRGEAERIVAQEKRIVHSLGTGTRAVGAAVVTTNLDAKECKQAGE